MSAAPSRPDAYYGGQAIIEGVMIRAPRHMAMAVRHPNGEIVRRREELTGFTTGWIRRVPLARGAFVLWETLALGLRAINYSSRIALAEEGEREGDDPTPPAAGEDAGDATDAAVWGSMALGIVFAIAIFFVGPVLFANFLESQGVGRAGVVAIEAATRLALFVAYIALIGLMPDIRRMFQYHGAEHMTIHAYEASRPLTVAAVRGLPKAHTRCGTSFLAVVIVIALAAFLAFDLLVDEGIVVRIASRVALLPPIAGVSYEALRLGARYESHAPVRALFTPNLWLQGLTTRVPDDDQIEVAIAAFESATGAPEAGGAEALARRDGGL